MGLNRVKKTRNRIGIERALISVSDKSGLEELVEGLYRHNKGIRIYSTGGTYQRIAGILGPERAENLCSVAEYTGQPEMQGGLVKTLDFKIYLGLLSEPFNTDHRRDLERSGAEEFDLVAVNLYPFRETIAQEAVTAEDARAHIDIGGPCMLRASAKNYIRVVSLCEPERYGELIAEMDESGGTVGLESRFRYACASFRHTAAYDGAIAQYLSGQAAAGVKELYSLEDDDE